MGLRLHQLSSCSFQIHSLGTVDRVISDRQNSRKIALRSRRERYIDGARRFPLQRSSARRTSLCESGRASDRGGRNCYVRPVLFVRVTTFLALVPATTLPKDRVCGEAVSFVNALPFTGTSCGPAPQLRIIDADRGPPFESVGGGANVTVIWQSAPGDRLAPPQVSISVKSVVPMPALPTPTLTTKETGWAKEFVTEIV